MRFWDREKEVRDLKAHIKSEPNSILFVYGPKSSGKSTLLMKVAEELPENDYAIYWYDLREELVSGYESVLGIFFKETGWKKKMLEGLSKMFKINVAVFELDPSELSNVMSRKDNPFSYMRRELEKKRVEGKKPIIVFDELQKLKGVYMNTPNNQRLLVNELFNFFVRLTKVLHLAHVIVMTSDTFFIEEVYTSSSLKNTSTYYLVDYFDDETARKILIEEGLSKEDADYIVDMSGGVPWVMAEVLSNGNPKEKLMVIYDQVKSRLLGYIENKMINGEDEKITYRVLEKVLKGLYPKTPEESREVRNLVQAEVLFYEPIKRKIKFQTKLDERAARELLLK